MSRQKIIREAQQRAIQELKQTTKGTSVPIGDSGESARIHIHARGEEVFYQEGDRALLFDMAAVYDRAVAMRRIKRWDNNDKVTAEEVEAIVGRVVELLWSKGWTPTPGWKSERTTKHHGTPRPKAPRHDHTMNKAQELMLKAIQELKQSTKGTQVPIGDSGEFARILIPGRGEEVFYQEGERALLFEIEALFDRAVAMRKIKRWDNNDKVTAEEVEAIVGRVAELLRNRGWKDPTPGWKD